MSRYIDSDALKEAMHTYGFHSVDQTITEFVEDTLPTADVVEVVRCKDCEWWKSIFSWNGKEHKVCVRESAEPLRESDDYCSYGERKILLKP